MSLKIFQEFKSYSFSDYCGVVALLFTLLLLPTRNNPNVFYIILVCVIFLFLFLFIRSLVLNNQKAFFLEQLVQAAKLAESLEKILFHLTIKNEGDDQDHYNNSIVRSELNTYINELKYIFKQLTHNDFRVCIKQIEYDDNTPPINPNTLEKQKSVRINTLLSTYVKDESSNYTDNVYLSGNSDFEELVECPSKGYFLSNNLVKMTKNGSYKNPHYTLDMIKQKKVRYKATIVWPLSVINEPNFDVPIYLGFLCVDTMKINSLRDFYPLIGQLSIKFLSSIFYLLYLAERDQ